MISNKIFRLIHTNNSLWQAQSSKALLGKLRKKTGYTFSNCKKALELHDNDLVKAEAWLKEQAQSLGWSKATKLQGRTTSQGLVAVIVDKNHGALVEVNCETDFVARNKQFQGFTESIAHAVLQFTSTIEKKELINKVLLDSDTLKALPGSDGKSLADHSALLIGQIGENIGIRRALCMKVDEELKIAGCTHPSTVSPQIFSCGRYGAMLTFKSPKNNREVQFQLCQHIIGMNPTKIGNSESDEPNSDVDSESTLIYQEFIVDPDITVQQVLKDNEMEILDFARFQMGESIETTQSLDSVETCG